MKDFKTKLRPIYFPLKQLLYFLIKLPKLISANLKVLKFLFNTGLKKKISILNVGAVGPLLHSYEYLHRTFKSNDPEHLIISNEKWCNDFFRVKFTEKYQFLESEDLYNQISSGGYMIIKLFKLWRNIELKNGFSDWTKKDISLLFTTSEIEYGHKLSGKIGLDLNKPFVCISCKDNFYWKNKRGEDKYWDVYRDTDFSELSGAIDYLILKGYQVVRMSAYDSNINVKWLSLNMLDSKERSFMDFFLHSRCLFSIHGDSGIAIFPLLFDKPLLLHNCIPMGESPVHEKGFYIPKILYFKNRILPLKEYFKTKSEYIEPKSFWITRKKISLDAFQNIKYYQENNIEITNTPSEVIINGIKDLECHFLQDIPLSQTDQNLINSFRNIFPSGHQMRLTSAMVAPSFINKYKEMLG